MNFGSITKNVDFYRLENSVLDLNICDDDDYNLKNQVLQYNQYCY